MPSRAHLQGSLAAQALVLHGDAIDNHHAPETKQLYHDRNCNQRSAPPRCTRWKLVVCGTSSSGGARPADLLLATSGSAKTSANRTTHLKRWPCAVPGIASTPSLELSKQLLCRWRLLSSAGVRHDVPDKRRLPGMLFSWLAD